MKTLMRILLAISIILLSANAFAATYYASASGDDQNSGTNPSTPWEHCPGMTGWGGSATLKNGDIVYFRSQDTWSITAFAMSVAGVTYDGGTYGTGTRAKLEVSTNKSSSDYESFSITNSDIIFKNFEFDGNDHNFTFAVNALGKNITNVEINNCIVHDNWDHSTTGWFYPLLAGSWDGHTVDNVRFINCTVYNTYHEGILFYPKTANATAAVTNGVIRGCTVYNTGQEDLTFGVGILLNNKVIDAIVEFNYVYNCPDRGIEISSNVGGYAGPSAKICYNIFKDNGGKGIYINNQEARTFNLEIYGNLCIDNGRSPRYWGNGVHISGGNYQTSTIKIYNNTIYSITNTSTFPVGLMLASTISGTPTIEVKNNIFYTDDHQCVYDQTGGKITRGYNLYYRTSGASDSVVYDGGTTYNRSTIKNWDSNAQNTDPQFVATSNLPTAIKNITGPNTDGLNIQSGSPSKDSGVDLGSLYKGSINLITRPSQAGWDIGAYEYSAEPKPPSPPANVRVVVPQN